MRIDTQPLIQDFGPHGPALVEAVQRVLAKPNTRADDLARVLQHLPGVRPSFVDTDKDAVTIGRHQDLSTSQASELEGVLKDLKPWRKGPFNLFGVEIDSEWKSSVKWRRVAPHLKPLQGRKVLDVGSSNGYYLFRMAAAKPRLLLGIEPYAAYYYQYLAIQHYLHSPGTHCLPLKIEELPEMPRWFDTVFCMGILYHRRSPLETLSLLNRLLGPRGQLILETLIIPGEDEIVLSPRDRYGRMRNVFFIPTVNCLTHWMQRCGFHKVKCVDTSPTTLEEQRKTPWIDSDSLETFLDPLDNTRTVEGYPAPIRAVMIAESK